RPHLPAFRPSRAGRAGSPGTGATGRENGGVQRPVPATIPDAPGSYQFKDAAGRVLYVGKAKSLRSRVMSYFSTGLSERTAQMVSTADSVEWIAVRNEVEALFLEYNLIKKHRPRFNIRLKDDKSYPFLAVTLDEEWPRAQVMRGSKRKGVRYFGPYAHAYAIRETLDLLRRASAIRSSRFARPSNASRWSTRRKRTTTSSGWSTTRSRRRCRCSWCGRAASSVARDSSSTKWRTSGVRSWWGGCSSSSTATS